MTAMAVQQDFWRNGFWPKNLVRKHGSFKVRSTILKIRKDIISHLKTVVLNIKIPIGMLPFPF